MNDYGPNDNYTPEAAKAADEEVARWHRQACGHPAEAWRSRVSLAPSQPEGNDRAERSEG